MWNGQTVSLVLPAYNEEPNIARAVSEFRSFTFMDAPVFDEVVVVDNNSRDRTAALAAEAGARVVGETRQGYGNAMQRGLREATGDIIVLCEPDGTFVARDVCKLLVYSDDFDMVCGTRTTRELLYKEANMGWFLRLGNILCAKLLEVFYGTCSLSDCGCSFRLIRRARAETIRPLLTVGGSHFLPNMVIAAKIKGLSFIEVPVSYGGRVGESKITGSLKGAIKTGMAMGLLILRMWPAYLRRNGQS